MSVSLCVCAYVYAGQCVWQASRGLGSRGLGSRGLGSRGLGSRGLGSRCIRVCGSVCMSSR